MQLNVYYLIDGGIVRLHTQELPCSLSDVWKSIYIQQGDKPAIIYSHFSVWCFALLNTWHEVTLPETIPEEVRLMHMLGESV